QGPSQIDVSTDPLSRVVKDCHYAWVCSGTATLEVGLVGVPMTVGYDMHPVSRFVAKRLIGSKHVSLVNLCLDEAVVTELLGEKFSAQAIVEDTLKTWDNQSAWEGKVLRLEALR